ncbi:hypothetical protein D3C77_351550 [compost metagenome]
MPVAEIQLDLFATGASVTSDSRVTQLMRPHKWAHGPMDELPLVSIEVVPFGDRWMWATCLNSHNGAAQGGKALPKWGKFAPSRFDAFQLAVDEVRGFMHRATSDEQVRIIEWLGGVISAAVQSR